MVPLFGSMERKGLQREKLTQKYKPAAHNSYPLAQHWRPASAARQQCSCPPLQVKEHRTVQAEVFMGLSW